MKRTYTELFEGALFDILSFFHKGLESKYEV